MMATHEALSTPRPSQASRSEKAWARRFFWQATRACLARISTQTTSDPETSQKAPSQTPGPPPTPTFRTYPEPEAVPLTEPPQAGRMAAAPSRT